MTRENFSGEKSESMEGKLYATGKSSQGWRKEIKSKGLPSWEPIQPKLLFASAACMSGTLMEDVPKGYWGPHVYLMPGTCGTEVQKNILHGYKENGVISSGT